MRCDDETIRDMNEDLLDARYESMEKGETHTQPDNISYEILKCYQLVRSVSYFAITDTVMSGLFVFVNPWYIIMAFCSGSGYFMAQTYNYKWLIAYASYQCLLCLVQFVLVILYATQTDNATGQIIFDSVLSTIFMMFSLYVISFTFKTIRALKNLIDGDLYQLRNIKNIKIKFLYW